MADELLTSPDGGSVANSPIRKAALMLQDCYLYASAAATDPKAVAWRDPRNTNPGQSVTFDPAVAAKWPHIYSQALAPIKVLAPAAEPPLKQASDSDRHNQLVTELRAALDASIGREAQLTTRLAALQMTVNSVNKRLAELNAAFSVATSADRPCSNQAAG